MENRLSLGIVCLFAQFALGASNADEVALVAQINNPEASKILQKLLPDLNRSFAKAESVTFCLLHHDESSLEPVLIVQAEDPAPFLEAAQTDDLLKEYLYTFHGSELVGTRPNSPISDEQVAYIHGLINNSSSPISLTAYPKVLFKVLQDNPTFSQQLQTSHLALLWTQLETLESLQLRAFSAENDTLRTVLIAQATEKSPLFDFFNQRLPKEMPSVWNNISLPEASFYGYALFNHDSMTQYMDLLGESWKKEHPTSFWAQPLDASLTAPADGSLAFWGDADLRIRECIGGHWTTTQAQALLEALAHNSALKAEHPQSKVVASFWVEESPVWQVDVNDAPPRYAALYKGNFLSAPTQKATYDLCESFVSPQKASKSLGETFTWYPTIAGQCIMRPQALVAGLERLFPLGLFSKITFVNTSKPIYAALSLKEGSAALTLDLPWNFVEGLDAVVHGFVAKEDSVPMDAPATASSEPQKSLVKGTTLP
jgi:hypothetical protein